ncbi:MAG: hypothetical protein ACE5KM_20865 [Planctomycetaceae bacterium]
MDPQPDILTRRDWLASSALLGVGIAGSPWFSGDAVSEEGRKAAVIDIGNRRELFVEDGLIERLAGNAALRLHHPTPREIALVHDKPWEGSGSGYHTVFQDGDRYRLYYRGLHMKVAKGKLSTGRHKPFSCYAESKDGIHWTRPELGIVAFEGSKKNNIILQGPGTHNFTPFKDENPDCPASQRYKALGGIRSEGGLFAFKSADGVHWSLMSDKPVITNGAFDSQNLAFWDPTFKQYRAYWRYFTKGVTTKKVWKPGGVRAIRTGASRDFLHWADDADLKYVDSPSEQLYTNQVKPYYRAPHILIGFPTRYVDRGWTASTRALPDPKNRKLRASANKRYGTAITEGLLMAGRDGVTFKRWNEAFLRPGIGRRGTWQYGQQYIAWHVVETKSSLPGAPNELSLYATEDYWHGKGGKLRRYTLRLDGFVSVNAPMKGGELVTKPLTFEGDTLSLNVATSAAGSVRVEIQHPDGKPLPGFALKDCPANFGDAIELKLVWNGNPDLGKLAGKPVRLRFVLNDADLYAFRFDSQRRP